MVPQLGTDIRAIVATQKILQEGYILNKVITFFFQMVRRASILNKVITCFKWYAGLQYFADLIIHTQRRWHFFLERRDK